MNAGSLRHRITIQRKIKMQDPNTGSIIETWDKAFDINSSFVYLSGKELLLAQSNKSKVQARVKIRYNDNISFEDRIFFRNKLYNIEAITPDNESGLEWMTIFVSEGARVE